MAQAGLILPVVYDGTIPWDQWVFLFEVAADMNGWRSEPVKMANMLMFSLRGHALSLCLTFDESIRKDYETLKAKLGDVLCPEDTMDVLISQLERRKRLPYETLVDLKVDILKMVAKVYPGMEPTVLEKHARVAFLKSIGGTPYGEKTIDAQPKTLEEALAKAQFFEQREQTRSSHQMACNEELEEEIVTERRVKKARPKCYKCGEFGHIKSSCPSRG